MAVVPRTRTAVEDRYPSRIGAEPELLPRLEPAVYGTAGDGPLGESELQEYERNGFLSFESLLPQDDLQPYLDEIARLRTDEITAHRPETVNEPGSREVRSIFAFHEFNRVLRRLVREPRIVQIARQLLGSEVYIHQSRINYKPGFRGREFYWHSDFETWHVEDGMPRMRAVSCSISLVPNYDFNGPLMLVPGSHHQFLSCAGRTPENHYKESLKAQEYGVPDNASLQQFVEAGGITAPTGPAGTVTFFECNVMHGSNSNITPFPRSNAFIVFNSVENTLEEPFCGLRPRPHCIANRRDYTPLRPLE